MRSRTAARRIGPRGRPAFGSELYRCLAARADVLFELADVVLCAEGPVRTLAGLPLPRAADGRLMLAADVSNWLRPGAATNPDRLSCHVYRPGKGQAQMIPGWPYSVIAALKPGADLVDRDAGRAAPGP